MIKGKVTPLIVGMVLILVGIGVLGTTAQQNFLPDQSADEISYTATTELRDKWAEAEIQEVEPIKKLGEGFALLYIPRLGQDWRAVIVEGTNTDDLMGKIGHFPRSADPGKVGNFALAAHRLTKGSLFRHLDEVKKGDEIIVETADRWLVYEAYSKKIISPTQTDAVEPVPFKRGEKPTQALITLSTCHPWYSSTQRLLVFGVLKETRLKQMGPPEGLPEIATKK